MPARSHSGQAIDRTGVNSQDRTSADSRPLTSRSGSLLEQRAPVSDLSSCVAAAITRRLLARPPTGREQASNHWQLMA
jgi:hypothetical protein